MAQQTINAGPPYSGAGDLIAIGWGKANSNFNELYALQSRTLSAADPRFAGATNEASIDNAINLPSIGAVATGSQRVVVPASMLPYNAALVNFSPFVQMVREGGDWSVWDITAYGADPLNTLDSTAAIVACLLATPGGLIAVPSGSYKATSTINQTFDATGRATIVVRGVGPGVSKIITTVTTTPGWVVGGTTNDSYHALENLDILQSGLTLPLVARPGNYGLRITGSNSPGLTLRQIRVRYFGDVGFRDEGGHGPINMENVEVQACSAFGAQIVDSGGFSEEDVSWKGGNIQFCWGGITMNSNKNCSFEGVDIELAGYAQLPAVQFTGSAEGNTFAGCTVSVGAVPSPAAVVDIESGRGNVFLGGLNVTTVAGVDNILLATSNASWNTFIAGSYNNVSPGGGYYANITNGSRNTFITPRLVGFTAGRGLVNDTNNANIEIGVGTVTQPTDLGILIPGGRIIQNVAAPAALASGNNNNIDFGLNASSLRITANAAGSTLTGIVAPSQSGARLRLFNMSGGGTLTLSHQDANSSAANRFLSPTGANVVLAVNAIADLEYEALSARWQIVNTMP